MSNWTPQKLIGPTSRYYHEIWRDCDVKVIRPFDIFRTKSQRSRFSLPIWSQTSTCAFTNRL